MKRLLVAFAATLALSCGSADGIEPGFALTWEDEPTEDAGGADQGQDRPPATGSASKPSWADAAISVVGGDAGFNGSSEDSSPSDMTSVEDAGATPSVDAGNVDAEPVELVLWEGSAFFKNEWEYDPSATGSDTLPASATLGMSSYGTQCENNEPFIHLRFAPTLGTRRVSSGDPGLLGFASCVSRAPDSNLPRSTSMTLGAHCYDDASNACQHWRLFGSGGEYPLITHAMDSLVGKTVTGATFTLVEYESTPHNGGDYVTMRGTWRLLGH